MKLPRHKQYGFSLVELAVVLVIVGIVITMGLKATMSVLESSTYSVTKAKQEQLKGSLVGFLRTNGRLPCPDNGAGVATGVEASPCTDGYGVIPWQTLGISRDSAIDGWGNFFTYRVANGSVAGSKNWTSKTVPASDFSVNELKTPTITLTFQELDAAGTIFGTIKTAVAVILSHGKNGFGAKTTKVGDRIPVTEAGASETINANNATTTFVLRPVSDSLPYDDLLVFMTPQDLLQPLVSEGTLKACQAYCPPPVSSICTTASGTCTCAAPGVSGTPSVSPAIPCTGSCGLCTINPIITACTPTPGSIPIGVTPLACI